MHHYIPISECYTGKPLTLKGYPNSNHQLPPPHPHSGYHNHGPGYKQLPNSPGVHHHHQQQQQQQHQMTSKLEETTANYDVPRTSVFTKVALPTSKSAINNSSTSPNSNGIRIPEPPPRPPKPTKFNSRSASENCSSLPGTNNYFSSGDHSPSLPLDNQCDLITPTQFNPTISSTSTLNINNNSILNSPVPQPLTLDDVYDFPKSEPVFSSLRKPIPAPGNRAGKGNSHSYTNAPPGHLSKPPVFTYDYKGTLPTCLDDNHITFDSETSDRSPLTPNSAFDSLSSNGSLSKSLTPPAVNRDLKPRRKGSDSDANSSPTSPTFTLSPPPAHFKHHQPTVKPTRNLNDTPPRVPSRGRQFQLHTRDASNSDEDIISYSSNFHKRNSSTDDQSRRAFTMPRKSHSESPNVTYLDLDLQESSDKDSSRPRSSNSSDSFKSSLTHSKDLIGASNLSGSQSTVYKSIDFVATDAFRQLRISSQRLIERE